jgi:hypothetical protein
VRPVKMPLCVTTAGQGIVCVFPADRCACYISILPTAKMAVNFCMNNCFGIPCK